MKHLAQGEDADSSDLDAELFPPVVNVADTAGAGVGTEVADGSLGAGGMASDGAAGRGKLVGERGTGVMGQSVPGPAKGRVDHVPPTDGGGESRDGREAEVNGSWSLFSQTTKQSLHTHIWPLAYNT